MSVTLYLPFLIFESISSGCVRYWQIHFASKQILSELSQVTFHMKHHLCDIYSPWQKQAQTCLRVPLFSLWEDELQNDSFTKEDSLLHGRLLSYLLFKIICVVAKRNTVTSLQPSIQCCHLAPLSFILPRWHSSSGFFMLGCDHCLGER